MKLFPHHLKTAALLATIFIPFGIPAAAQETPEEEAEPTLELSFRTYGRGSANYMGLFYEARPDQFEPLRILRGSRSIAYDYRGTAQINLYRRVANEDPEIPWTYVPVATAEFENGDEDQLMLVTPRRSARNNGNGATPEAEFNIAILPSLTDAVGNEEIAFYNGTGAFLQGVLGDRSIELQRGLSQPYSIGEFPPGEGVRVGLAVRLENDIRSVFFNHLQFSSDRRYLIVLLPPEQPDSFEIVAFRLSL